MADKKEDADMENEEKRTKSRSPSPAIKSTAVVKYTAFQSPVGYARLQCNTDLNMPPSNWGAAIDSYGLRQILPRGAGLSSFRMAHMFPDCVGEVDVVAGAECIKKLLRLPYQPNGTVSMMVHRVENTLLLDDFDVYDYLMKSEWSWLKDFFYENILKTMSEQEKLKLMLSPAPSSALQLTHKFLSHSVTHSQLAEGPTPPPLPVIHRPMTITGPFLPEPETREKPEDFATEHLYNRNVRWTFEDIHMLIGSDLPIFGDSDRPCVSLRLRDARETINVLTGIDYWLDNLMCNVPEVLMCYHLDGIVQKYEPMKTEDLPNMENSKFSPKVIRNVAQNILSFLKSNATKSGHTYWLFKGPHDDVVKLYDLTSLCPDSMDNPFTTPVAMLLYRVAKNMRLTNRSKHVKQLLEHVIKLLKVERYPQIVASSHYMLADLCVPATTDPVRPIFDDEDSEPDCDYTGFSKYPTSGDDDENICNPPDEVSPSKEDEVFQSKEQDETGQSKEGDLTGQSKEDESLKTKEDEAPQSKEYCEKTGTGNQTDHEKSLALQIRGLALKEIGDRVNNNVQGNKRDSASNDTSGKELPDRCGRALHHALQGLLALHNITIDKCKEEERERLKQKIISEEQHPKMANPYEPIKMTYEPLSNTKSNSKEHSSRSRRRKRDKKTNEKSNYLIETNCTVDRNAIRILRDKKVFPTWREPNRDDNFAWKLHLKTLLYEEICVAYATLAEYSYAQAQYGFSLKYIDIVSKCQKLLCNMIIKSKVVNVSCLIGRVADNYFQISKNWRSLDNFKMQFQRDHDIDTKIRLEIENDMAEEVDSVTVDDFDLDISIPTSEVSAMLSACALYTRGVTQVAAERRGELLRRRATVINELAVRYMNDAHHIFNNFADEPDQNDPRAKLMLKQINVLFRKTLDSLDEATEIFKEVNDIPNLALLYCNRGRYLRLKAYCDPSPTSSEKRRLYSDAEEMYHLALKLLGSRETCGGTVASVWDLVSWELSSHLYSKAVIMQDTPEVYGTEVSSVAEALKHALKYCLLSPGPRQYMYQFRAAMIYHRLGSLYHSQYRTTSEEGPKRRTLLNATKSNYEQAANMFASLEDPSMFLTVQMEHVAVLETQAAVSPNVKLKSLQSAVQLLRQCHSIMKVLKNKEAVEEKEPPRPEDNVEKDMQEEFNLLSLFENRLHFILKSIIQYCRSKSNRDYERITDLYKKLYCASLKIKKDENIRVYASSICDVLVAMDDISKQYDTE